MLDRRVLRVEDGRARLLADLSGVATGPCNDMVVDAAGRAYVGNFGFDRHAGEPERTACIARVESDGRVTRVAEDLHFPNGTVITPDGRTLIVAETLAHRLTAFDIDATRGLARRRVFAEDGKRVELPAGHTGRRFGRESGGIDGDREARLLNQSRRR